MNSTVKWVEINYRGKHWVFNIIRIIRIYVFKTALLIRWHVTAGKIKINYSLTSMTQNTM